MTSQRANRKIVLTAKNVCKIQFFDGQTFTLLSELDMPAPVHELALSPDGRKAVGSVYGGGVFGRNQNPDHRLVVIDLESRAVEDFISTEDVLAPHGLMFDGDGLLWVTGELNRLVLAVDFDARRIARRIDIGGAAHWLTVDPLGRRIYASNKTTDRIAVIAIDGAAAIDGVSVPNLCEGLAIVPEDRRLYVASHSEAAFNVIDTVRNELIQVVPVAGAPGNRRQLRRLGISPDRRFLLMSSQADRNVAVFRLPDLAQVALIPVGIAPMGVGFPDQPGTAVVCNHDEGTVSQLDLEAGTVTAQFGTGLGCEYITYYG